MRMHEESLMWVGIHACMHGMIWSGLCAFRFNADGWLQSLLPIVQCTPQKAKHKPLTGSHLFMTASQTCIYLLPPEGALTAELQATVLSPAKVGCMSNASECLQLLQYQHWRVPECKLLLTVGILLCCRHLL